MKDSWFWWLIIVAIAAWAAYSQGYESGYTKGIIDTQETHRYMDEEDELDA
jgi:hypothetical protein